LVAIRTGTDVWRIGGAFRDSPDIVWRIRDFDESVELRTY